MGGQRRRANRGQEPRLERTAKHTQIDSAKGGNHCDGYRIGDSRLLAEPQYLPVGGKSFADSEPVDRKANRLELRPNRKKGRKLSAQFKAKAPPFCTGGSGLLHTKCVSISVIPPRTHCMTKFFIWCKMGAWKTAPDVIRWTHHKCPSRLKGVPYEQKAVGHRENHSSL